MKSILLSFLLIASLVSFSQKKSDTTEKKQIDTSKVAAPKVDGLQPGDNTPLFTMVDINELYTYVRRKFSYDEAEPLVNWIQKLVTTRSEEWRKLQDKTTEKKKGEPKKE